MGPARIFRRVLLCGLVLIGLSFCLYLAASPDDAWDRASDAALAPGLLATFAGFAGSTLLRERQGPAATPTSAAGADRPAPRVPTASVGPGPLSALAGVRPRLLRRATRLRAAALMVDRDHDDAVDAVRTAWSAAHRARTAERLDRIAIARLPLPAHRLPAARELERLGFPTARSVLDTGVWPLAALVGREDAAAVVAAARGAAESASWDTVVRLDADRAGPQDTALVTALWVLRQAGPDVAGTAAEGRDLAGRLGRLLADAAPAAGCGGMLRATPGRRARALTAVDRLDSLLERAGQEEWPRRFAQLSVDLLRGADGAAAALAAWADFAREPHAYHGMLESLVGEYTRDSGGHHALA
ncbi:hypothetical protein ABZ990_09705 [Streptomyces sp. NPDC046203]|uniref:hypothetical protein n=1 Tax=Streptomyces sp. NPDC046203 TaxID=3154602 RepID=UPI0033CD0085